MAGSPAEITQLLDRIREGDSAAANQLAPRIYEELHAIAQRFMRRERPNHTLQPTALANEVFMRLAGGEGGAGIAFANRAHFFALAARVMRQYLVKHALARQAAKRGGGAIAGQLVEDPAMTADLGTLDLLALDEALTNLAALDPRKAQLVEHRFFGGMTSEETAEALGVSLSTVEADWRVARAWLSSQLSVHNQRGMPP